MNLVTYPFFLIGKREGSFENDYFEVVDTPSFFDKKIFYSLLKNKDRNNVVSISYSEFARDIGYFDYYGFVESIKRLAKAKIIIKKNFSCNEVSVREGTYSFVDSYKIKGRAHKKGRSLTVKISQLFEDSIRIDNNLFRIRKPYSFRIYELIIWKNKGLNMVSFNLDLLRKFIPSGIKEENNFRKKIKEALINLKELSLIRNFHLNEDKISVWTNPQFIRSHEHEKEKSNKPKGGL